MEGSRELKQHSAGIALEGLIRNEVIQKLSLEVLPILELPFVWEMNSKLIKKERERDN